jgi:hypothetical protein
MHLRHIAALALAMALLAATAAPTAREQNEPVERYTAFAINMGDLSRAATAIVNISIERWSSDQERDRLLKALLDGGPDRLAEQLDDLPRAGHIRTPDSLGYPLAFARRVPQPDGGERVVLVTTRPIGYWESVVQPRTIEYPFTVVELRLAANGEGEGKLSLATRIVADREHSLITLENYGTQPVMLTNVKRER